MSEPDPITGDSLWAVIPIRAYARPVRPRQRGNRVAPPMPELVLVFDTESRTDLSQRLTFGSARLHQLPTGRLRREWLIAADDLPEADLATLRAYVESNTDDRGRRIRLLTRREFVEEVLWKVGYEAHALIVGFNLPFDLSRLAVDWRDARGSARGGFSLQLFDWTDASGASRRHQWRPNITVKALGSKRQLLAFTTPGRIDPENRVDGHAYRGRFLDLHQLAFALTDRGYTLDGAARAFGLKVGKQVAERHGVVTEAYIDYNRHDVRVTWELYLALAAEWARHPIALAPEQAFSPATIGRAYLRAMGVEPPLARQDDFPVERLGQAMSAYLGGRAEVRIRRVPLPVRYVDFTSMYPTVFELLDLWSWVIAERFEVVDATDVARLSLSAVTREALHNGAIWPDLAGVFCLTEPDGDLLPVRAAYGAAPDEAALGVAGALSIGLNWLTSRQPLWYSLADLVAAKILGRTTPRIKEAFRVVPVGVADGLRPVDLRGRVRVDPREVSLFRTAIEERKRLAVDPSLSDEERDRLGLFLKTVANAASYGLFAQYDQLEPHADGVAVEVDGLWHFTTRVTTPEVPGQFCFPPLAATITGAGRLLLALVQADVESRGGGFVACDTDSLLIVASETGGLMPCPNGPERLPDGTPAVRVLPWVEVDEIIAGLASLSPYDPAAVPSLLKLEDENLGPDGKSAELWAVGISAKRYVLYNRTTDGIRIRKPSEHGLGLYRRPVADPPGWDRGWPAWVEEVWTRFIDELEGRVAAPDPTWFAYPAVGEVAISSPAALGPFATLNQGLDYSGQIKPFNFMLIGHIDPMVPLPDGADRSRFALVAPYRADPSEYLKLPWRNRYDGRDYQATTARDGEPGAVRLKTYGDVIRAYRLHPEVKSGDPRGGPCLRSTVGFLPRRHVIGVGVRHIGKESNRLDEVEDGLVSDAREVYVEYRDERGEWWAALPALRRLRDERGWRHLAEASGLSERAVRYALNGGKVPHREARARLLRLVAEERSVARYSRVAGCRGRSEHEDQRTHGRDPQA